MSNYKETIMKYVFFLCAFISVISVFLICVFLFVNGVPAIIKIGFREFIFGTRWKPTNNEFGILPMIIGSIYITLGAVIIGVPVGVLTAIFMAKFCRKSMYKFIKPAINLLAGIPSVVYGFFGIMVVVPFVRKNFCGSGSSILSASIVLGIMILPTIISISEVAISQVPNSYYHSSRALGVSHEQSVFYVVLPPAKSGIMAGIILGIGRAMGETMAVIMVAGNQAVVPKSIFEGARTLTSNIVMEMGYSADLHRQALIGTAVILFVFILMINSVASVIKRRIS